jgi:A/G-specific adenine glycosylase
VTAADAISERNRALLRWYAESRRDLPWRRSTDPYLVLVSEIMLQQTQVNRVVPAFTAFIDRFPSVDDLAGADPASVLEAWSGLGYNGRAIRLQAAARRIAEDGWPTTVSGLTDLPGIGPYTAAAIAAIAFGETVAAVDTNLRRILSRWEGEPLRGRHLLSVASEAVAEPASEWNQAMMDLGASVCRPRTPKCDRCPVESWCADPAVYDAPPRQGTFEGSTRQLRGAVVRAHVRGGDLRATGRELGRSDEEIDDVIASLEREGLLPRSPAPEGR